MSITKTIGNFDISQIAKSGQCFRLKEHTAKENTWQVMTREYYVEVKQEPESNVVEFSCTEDEFEKVWKSYFDLDTDYQAIIDTINPNDEYLIAAARFGKGIRILRQDPWETLISFTISQNNNIPRIKKSIDMLCTVHGEPHMTGDGLLWFEFPTPAKLVNMENLQNMGLGYRDKYIQKMAENVLHGKIKLKFPTWFGTEDIRNYLKSIYGIGNKVADCILLFGYHKTEIVPKDTWMNRIIKEHYDGKSPCYGKDSGVIQQYLFNYAVNGGDKNDNN